MSPEERAELKQLIREELAPLIRYIHELESAIDKRRENDRARKRRSRDTVRSLTMSRDISRDKPTFSSRNGHVTSSVTMSRDKKEKEIPNGSSPSFSPSHTLPLNLPLAPLPSEKEQKLAQSLNLEALLSELKPIYPYIDLEVEKSRIRGWLIANPGRKLSRRFVINWLNKIEKPLADVQAATAPSQFVTREMIDNWCVRKGYSKLAPIARGKLMGGKHYGVPITNADELGDALASILNDWLNTP